MANYVPLIVLVAFLGVFLMVYLSPGARMERARKAAMRREAEIERQRAEEAMIAQSQALFDLFVSNDGRPLPELTQDVQGVILKGDETCCAMSKGAQHIVSRKKTRYVGGSHGVSIRIAKGVRYHVGAYRGHPVTEEHEVVADSGSVYVTSKRFIFAGNKEVTSVPVPKIADVHLDGAKIVVIVENRVNPLIVGITQPYWAPRRMEHPWSR
jgi:hypothetical protein